MCDNPKDWAYKWITADAELCNGPCFLRKAVLTPDGSNAATATIYNGVDDNGEVVIVLRCGATGKDSENWRVPLFLERGLFVDCSDNLDGVHLQFIKV